MSSRNSRSVGSNATPASPSRSQLRQPRPAPLQRAGPSALRLRGATGHAADLAVLEGEDRDDEVRLAQRPCPQDESDALVLDHRATSSRVLSRALATLLPSGASRPPSR